MNAVISSGQYEIIGDSRWINEEDTLNVGAVLLTDFDATGFTLTPSDVGLGNVTNESKATMFTSPTFTETPIAPTATAGTNTTQVATTAFATEAANLVERYFYFGCQPFNPADGTTYYIGPVVTGDANTTLGTNYMVMPFNGTITSVSAYYDAGSVQGSGENATYGVRIVTTATELTGYFANGSANGGYKEVDTDLDFNDGDNLSFYYTTPTWATNPEGISLNIRITTIKR